MCDLGRAGDTGDDETPSAFRSLRRPPRTGASGPGDPRGDVRKARRLRPGRDPGDPTPHLSAGQNHHRPRLGGTGLAGQLGDPDAAGGANHRVHRQIDQQRLNQGSTHTGKVGTRMSHPDGGSRDEKLNPERHRNTERPARYRHRQRRILGMPEDTRYHRSSQPLARTVRRGRNDPGGGRGSAPAATLRVGSRSTTIGSGRSRSGLSRRSGTSSTGPRRQPRPIL